MVDVSRSAAPKLELASSNMSTIRVEAIRAALKTSCIICVKDQGDARAASRLDMSASSCLPERQVLLPPGLRRSIKHHLEPGRTGGGQAARQHAGLNREQP